MAFAAGLVVAAVIPASSKEKELAEDIKEKAQPLVDEATDVAKTIGQDLKEPAQEAFAAVRMRPPAPQPTSVTTRPTPSTR